MDDGMPSTNKKKKKELTKINGKIVVESTVDGIPYGPGANALLKDLSKLARKIIPLTFSDWRKVPKRITNDLWEYAEGNYEVDKRMRKKLMQTLGVMFRTWRSTIFVKHVLPHKDDLPRLKNPPLGLEHIPKTEWENFVKIRLGPTFMAIREKNKKQRNSYQYNHRLSRGGYVGLREKLKKERGPNEEIDRSELWCLARRDENKNYPQDLVPIVEKIEDLRKKSESGTVSFEGDEDILTSALGSKEHDGRVRGMGKFVTPSNYFHTPNPQAQWNKEKKALESRITYLEERMNAFLQRSLSDKTHIESHVEAQSSNKTPMMSSPQMKAQDGDPSAMEKLATSQKTNPLIGEKHAFSKGQPCKMAIGSLENIVAIGTIIEMKSLLFLVSIDVVINEDAMLPIPNEVEGLLYLKDAIGYHILWPKELIVDDSINVVFEKHESKYAKGIQDFEGLVKNFTVLGREHVRVPFEDDIFANSCYCYVGSNDLRSLIEMKVLGGNHLLLCIRYLFSKLKDISLSHEFGFINPVCVSLSGYKNHSGRNDQRACYIAQRLQGSRPNQILLMPYNPGFHWVLVAIDKATLTVYYLDSLMNEVETSLNIIIPLAIEKYQANLGNQSARVMQWEVVNAPKQPGNFECGYYVMRYMKEIIENPDILSKKFNGKERYTEEEIDEVRLEWIEHIKPFVK